jgi:hypothetical protein
VKIAVEFFHLKFRVLVGSTGYRKTGDYGYYAIMHFKEDEYSRNGQPTIRPKREMTCMGQRNGLHGSDIDGVGVLYNKIQPILFHEFFSKYGGGHYSYTTNWSNLKDDLSLNLEYRLIPCFVWGVQYHGTIPLYTYDVYDNANMVTYYYCTTDFYESSIFLTFVSHLY